MPAPAPAPTCHLGPGRGRGRRAYKHRGGAALRDDIGGRQKNLRRIIYPRMTGASSRYHQHITFRDEPELLKTESEPSAPRARMTSR